MGILKWFKRKRTGYPPEHDYWYTPFGSWQPTASGIAVDEAGAVKYLAVYACVSLISGDIARLPLNLYQKNRDGSKERVFTHPLVDLTETAPNDDMNTLNWRETLGTHLLLWGNHYSQIVRNGIGEIVELYPLPIPDQIKVTRPRGSLSLRYEWYDGSEMRNVGRDRMLHVAGWGFNGIVGKSPIGIAREAVGLGIAGDEFSSRFFSNSATPTGLISMPPEMRVDEKQAAEYLKKIKKEISGLGKSHSILLLRNGETYTQMTMPLKDAQFLESREFQKVEICGMYRVPPHKIAIHGANSNYNNLVQENLHYLDSCLMHWLTRIELTFNHQLLTPAERKKGLYFKFKTQSLLRGDHDARSNYYQTMIDRGIMSRNEVRALEELNPLPDDQRGDETILPLNFVFASDAGDIPDNGQGLPNDNGDNGQQRAIEWASAAVLQKEIRSITARDRIVKRYRRLIMDRAQEVINRENKSVKAKAGQPVDEWLDDFYQDFADYINRKMGPTLRSFLGSVSDIAVDDTGAEINQDEIDKWINDYVNTYVIRHVASSRGQIQALADEENAEEAINQRMDEWFEKRAEKITTRETVQGSQGIYQAVAFMAGMATVFRTRGKSCPYCQSLDGAVIRKGHNLVNDGDELKPDGVDSPMTFNGSKSHPPIHAGCDCYMTIG